MGGFGAISFAELIGADFLRISPQYSLVKILDKLLERKGGK